MKKALSLLLVLVIVMALFPAASAAQVDGYLSDLYVCSKFGAIGKTAMEFPATVSEDGHTVTVCAPDSATVLALGAKLSAAAPAGSKARVEYTATNGTAKTVNLAANALKGTMALPQQSCIAKGMTGNTLKITVGDLKGGDTQTYTVNVIRSVSLKSLSVEGVVLDQTFSPAQMEYTATTVLSQIQIQAVPFDNSYTVTYNGSDSGVIDLASGENTIDIRVAKDTWETTYVLKIRRSEPVEVRFHVTPANVRITVYDDKGMRLTPDDTGAYSILEGKPYSYTAACKGYVAQRVNVDEAAAGTVEVALAPVPVNDKIDLNLDVQWRDFRNSDSNMAITNAALPTKPEETGLKWAIEDPYGSWANAPSIGIIVDDALIYMGSETAPGQAQKYKIYKVSLETGELLAASDMISECSWGSIPPTYAEGMVFCPLTSGYVQAFNAKTLESLWVYHDPLGGQANAPITYSDGCIYVGWWNAASHSDANLVCLSVADEDPTRTDEEKIPLWTRAQSGGFYWAGNVVVGDALIFGSAAAGNADTPTASLVSVDKNTGETINELYGLMGDVRATATYSAERKRVFITSTSGYLYSAALDEQTGILSDLKQSEQFAVRCTSTPVVYGDYVYFCAGSGVKEDGGSGGFYVAKADTLEILGSVALQANGQSSPLLTTAYEDQGKLYFYMSYNGPPGGITVVTVDMNDYAHPTKEELYDAAGYGQFCIVSPICDRNGTLYYKNDSATVMAVGKTMANATSISYSLDDGDMQEVTPFSVNGTQRQLVVPVDTEKITVTAAGYQGAAVTINGEAERASLTFGDSDEVVATIVVAAANGDTRTYTVNFRRASRNAELAKLSASADNTLSNWKPVQPEFDPAGTDYAVSKVVDNYGKGWANVWTVVADPKAKARVFAISGLDENKTTGFNKETGELESTFYDRGTYYYKCYYQNKETTPLYVRIEVTAEDGVTVKNYYLRLTAGETYAEPVQPVTQTVYVTVQSGQTLAMEDQAVTAADRNYDGVIDLDEVLYAAHAAYPGGAEEGYAAAEDGKVSKLWGKEFANVTLSADGSDAALADIIRPGQHVSAVVLPQEEVIELIDAIGRVTKNSGDAIHAAREAYDALTKEQQELVSNYWILRNAERLYAELLEDVPVTVPDPGKSEDQKRAEAVEKRIREIGTVDQSSGERITGARNAYDALTDAQKRLVSNYDVLTAAEAAYAQLEKALPFVDVKKGDWFYDGVKYAYEAGLMKGVSETEFRAGANTTRGMIVTILARMEGVDTAAGETWYSAGREWAMRSGISDGTNMSGSITREQLAAMLYRYAKLKGYDVSASAALSGYSDASQVSDWAQEAMQWAVGTGLIQGSGNALNPQATATRGQIATILMRFSQSVVK